ADDLKAMRLALESNDQELALIHSYAAKLIAYLPDLFNTLSGEDQERYLNQYHKKLLFFKARVPNKTFTWLFELLDAGKVRLVEGIYYVQPEENGTFTIRASQTKTDNLLIYATGFVTTTVHIAKDIPLNVRPYQHKLFLPHEQGRVVFVD